MANRERLLVARATAAVGGTDLGASHDLHMRALSFLIIILLLNSRIFWYTCNSIPGLLDSEGKFRLRASDGVDTKLKHFQHLSLQSVKGEQKT
jgi:hypothetical protein